jgi:hypothetical protein
MVRVFLDIDIGDPVQASTETDAYNRTFEFLKEVGWKQLGLDAETPEVLDGEGDYHSLHIFSCLNEGL